MSRRHHKVLYRAHYPVPCAAAVGLPAPPAGDGAVPAAPSALRGNNSAGSGGSAGPSVAITTYDPQTGRYLAPDGQLQQVTNAAATPKSWKDLLPI